MSHKPWYHKGLRFSCKGSGNCCRTHGEYAYVYLSDPELGTISSYLGLRAVDFFERYCAIDEGYTVLRIESRSCPFLEKGNRCRIYPVRPKQCATWPFWQENLDDSARWLGPVADCCPGIGQGELHSAETVERLARETEEWYEPD